MNRDEYRQRAREFAPRVPKKLDDHKVRQIRENREGMTDKQRASLLGVHPNTVFRVRHRETWA